jgi:hypothetical protein
MVTQMTQMTQVPLRCRCGRVQGMATDVSPKTGNHIVCYCDDCQAYAHFLGRGDVLDAHGGTDIFHMTPSQLKITTGQESVRCLRLSEKGLMRWFTECCSTPMANTVSARLPVVGLVHCFMGSAADGRSRDELLGPPTGIHGRFAVGGLPPHAHPRAPLGLVVRTLRLLAGALVAGKGRPSPLFDPSSGAPVVEPRILTRAERDVFRTCTTSP